MKRFSLCLALLVAATGLAHAQGKKKVTLLPGQGIDWQGDWEAAVKEATLRNVPIMFAVHKDH